MKIVRIMMVVALALSCSRAEAQSVLVGPCLNCGIAAVPLPERQDMVLSLRDGRLVLVRSITDCLPTASALMQSADVAKAQCFR